MAHEPSPPSGRAALSLGILALGLAAGFAAMGSFGTVQEGAKAELALSDYTLGLVQGIAVAVPLALFSVPIGILVDRANRVRLFFALAALWTAGTLLTAYAPNSAVLFVARMMTGTGTTGALTAAISVGADLCVPAKRGRAMMIMTLGKSLGIAAGFGLAGALSGLLSHGVAGLAPWRAVHLVLALIFIGCLLPLFALREPPRREVAVAGAPFRVVWHELWSRRAFLAPLFVGQVSVVMADNAAIVWAAPVLGRSFGLRPDQFAGWLGALIFAVGLGGAVLGGMAADWGQRSGRRGGVLRGALLAAIVGAPAALFPITGSVPLFAVLLGLLVLCGTATGLVTAVALTVLIPNEARGLCIGLFVAVAGVIGYGVAPTLVAFVSQLLGGEAELTPALAIVGVATSALSVGAFALAMRSAPASAVKV